MHKPPLWRRALAELVGTYALVTAGCGAIVVDAQSHALGHVGVAACFGLVITVMIAALGHVAGAYFNPAVTIAFALIRPFPGRGVGDVNIDLGVGPAGSVPGTAGILRSCASRPFAPAHTGGRRATIES
jgi:hypothetical protein